MKKWIKQMTFTALALACALPLMAQQVKSGYVTYQSAAGTNADIVFAPEAGKSIRLTTVEAYNDTSNSVLYFLAAKAGHSIVGTNYTNFWVSPAVSGISTGVYCIVWRAASDTCYTGFIFNTNNGTNITFQTGTLTGNPTTNDLIYICDQYSQVVPTTNTVRMYGEALVANGRKRMPLAVRWNGPAGNKILATGKYDP